MSRGAIISPIFSIILYWTLRSLSLDKFSIKLTKFFAEYFLSALFIFFISWHFVLNIFITFAIAIIHTFLKLGFKSIEICLNISYILFEIYSTEIISETIGKVINNSFLISIFDSKAKLVNWGNKYFSVLILPIPSAKFLIYLIHNILCSSIFKFFESSDLFFFIFALALSSIPKVIIIFNIDWFVS